MKLVTKENKNWEISQKQKLITLGQSQKRYNEIIDYLINEYEASKRMAAFDYRLVCFKSDGVYQLNKAIEEIYGYSKALNDKKPSAGEQPIQTVDVLLHNGIRVKVPYGKIALSDLGEDAFIDISYNEDSNILNICGQTQLRYQGLVDSIVERTKVLLNTDSIYREQAIELGSDLVPEHLRLSHIETSGMVLSTSSKIQLKSILARIERPEMCKERGIPLKFSALISGKYGTGKTLLAFDIAKKAIANGWAFIYLKDPTKLAQVLRMSKTLDNSGSGIVIFTEDIDQVTSGQRDAALQDILNTIDGGDTKNMNVINLFTTNHLEKINPTFLRGKRIGTIITLNALDAATANEFIRAHTDGYDLQDEGLEEVCSLMEKHEIVPAFLAEILEKVKTNKVFDDDLIITAEDIKASLVTYLHQNELANRKDRGVSDEKMFATLLQKLILGSKFSDGETLENNISEIYNYVS